MPSSADSGVESLTSATSLEISNESQLGWTIADAAPTRWPPLDMDCDVSDQSFEIAYVSGVEECLQDFQRGQCALKDQSPQCSVQQ